MNISLRRFLWAETKEIVKLFLIFKILLIIISKFNNGKTLNCSTKIIY